MGLCTEFEYNKYVYTPATHHPSHLYSSKASVRDKKGKFSNRSYSITSLDDEFVEISCIKSLDSTQVINNPVPEDPIYQSLEVAKENTGDFEERKKIDVPHSGDVPLSSIIMDSSCLDEVRPFLEKKKSSSIYLNGESHPISSRKICTEPANWGFLDLSFYVSSVQGCVTDNFISSDGFVEIEIGMGLEDRECYSGERLPKSPVKHFKFRCNQANAHQNDDSALLEREKLLMLNKYSSEGLEMPLLPCKSKEEDSKANPKAYFSPIRKILDPMKSKSQQSSSMSSTDRNFATIESEKNCWNGTLHRLLLNDFLSIEHGKESGSQCVEKGHSSVVASFSSHSCGLLKLKFEHGVPFFEFSMKGPQDVLAAKIWRVGNSFNWVYTFHSLDIGRTDCRKGAKESKKEYSLIGQMQVLCHLCSEMIKNGTSDHSMIAEFVLYDVAHARKSLCAQESSHCSANSVKLAPGQSLVEGNHVSDLLNHKLQLGNVSEDDSDTLNNLPWAMSELHRYLQIAAVVVEVPFEERESLKEKPGNKFGVDKLTSLSDLSSIHWKNKDVINCINPANVKVVTSSGIHGQPITDDDVGPSSLLDRWRLGGGCDCGGWDIACPLSVLDCPSDQSIPHQSFMETCQPFKLSVQGLKEKKPALSVEVLDEGLYSVRFHAPLSMLQAFAISVAILHSSEISTLAGKGGKQYNSLKLLLEEEVRSLVDAVADEQTKVGKRMEEIQQQSFLLNPPLSPIARL